MDIGEDDRIAIAAALGREPTGVLAVVARHAEGQPRVIECQPWRVGKHGGFEPFPTLYWLVDPELGRAVSDLERQGGIGRCRAWLNEDPARVKALGEAHGRYAQARDRRARQAGETGGDRAGVEALRHRLKGLGVAGCADPQGIKCLHAHLAHHLAELAESEGYDRPANPVGAWCVTQGVLDE